MCRKLCSLNNLNSDTFFKEPHLVVLGHICLNPIGSNALWEALCIFSCGECPISFTISVHPTLCVYLKKIPVLGKKDAASLVVIQNIHTRKKSNFYIFVLSFLHGHITQIQISHAIVRISSKTSCILHNKTKYFTLTYLHHKAKTQYLHFKFHADCFLLPWMIPEQISRQSITSHN